jgi:hypothetical protein
MGNSLVDRSPTLNHAVVATSSSSSLHPCSSSQPELVSSPSLVSVAECKTSPAVSTSQQQQQQQLSPDCFSPALSTATSAAGSATDVMVASLSGCPAASTPAPQELQPTATDSGEHQIPAAADTTFRSDLSLDVCSSDYCIARMLWEFTIIYV